MEMGKLTAKLRDAVPVCFIENGREVKRYKNIEIPDELKVLPFADFKFDVPAAGAITFKIMFEAGILPTEWPQARERKSRSHKAEPIAETPTEAAQPDGAQPEAVEEQAQETTALAIIEEPQREEPATMEIAYNVTGEQRKALVAAIASFIGIKPIYQNAPTFAFTIGDYTVDKNGTLTGTANENLLQALAAREFIAK